MRGRPANGAAAVGTDGQRRKTGGHRGHAAAGGAARGQGAIPGVTGYPKQRIVGIPFKGELGHIGLAQNHHAGPAATGHRQFILLGRPVGQRSVAPGGGQPGHVEVVLDGDRHAIQRAQGATLLPALRAGLGRRFGLGVEGDQRIKLGVERPNACIAVLPHRQRGQGTGGKGRRQFAGAEAPAGLHQLIMLGSHRAISGKAISDRVNNIMINMNGSTPHMTS